MAQHGLQDRFYFPGFQDSMPPFFRAMDVLCHPSRREGAPRAVLEAMAAGRPVVAADVDGVNGVTLVDVILIFNQVTNKP